MLADRPVPQVVGGFARPGLGGFPSHLPLAIMVSARPQPRPSLRVCLTCLARVGPASTEGLIGLHRVLEVKYHASKLLAQLTMPSSSSSSSSPGTAWTPGPRDSALIIWEHSGRHLDARAFACFSGVIAPQSGDTRRSWTTFTRRLGAFAACSRADRRDRSIGVGCL